MKKLTENDILKIIENKSDCEKWYKNDSKLVKKSYCEWASNGIINVCGEENRLPFSYDKECKYNKGKRNKIREIAKKYLNDEEKIKYYINYTEKGNKTNRHEERMCHCLYAQQDVSGFEVLDIQIPTTDGGHDKIDLLIKSKDGTIYMTEAKKFSPFESMPSDETMLRCVLEIQTYYQKITDYQKNVNNFIKRYNLSPDTKFKKAVLVDDNTLAYKQRKEPWAKRVMDCFDITLFKIIF